MNVCELVQNNLLASETPGARRFQDLLRDDAAMWRIFEKFVYNFCRQEQTAFTVSSDQIGWDVEDGSPDSRALLPIMQTDVTLHSPERVAIIDTKFYSNTLQARHSKQSYHSANLYQLFSYLKNAERRGGAYRSAAGVLLYPTVRETLCERVVITGHPIYVYTLNLDQPWQGIHSDLLALLDRIARQR